MNSNPWNVGSINEFSYFNCPECTFHTKEDKNFQDHAMRNHPLSSILFSKGTKLITFSGKSDLNQLKQMASEQKCNDELMTKYNLPDLLLDPTLPTEQFDINNYLLTSPKKSSNIQNSPEISKN